MFYNVAEERERRKRWREERSDDYDGRPFLSASALARATGSQPEMQRSRGSVGNRRVGSWQRRSRRTGSWSSLPVGLPGAKAAATTTLSQAGGNSRWEKSSLSSKGALWPPSHLELMASVSEDTPPAIDGGGMAIPCWTPHVQPHRQQQQQQILEENDRVSGQGLSVVVAADGPKRSSMLRRRAPAAGGGRGERRDDDQQEHPRQEVQKQKEDSSAQEGGESGSFPPVDARASDAGAHIRCSDAKNRVTQLLLAGGGSSNSGSISSSSSACSGLSSPHGAQSAFSPGFEHGEDEVALGRSFGARIASISSISSSNNSTISSSYSSSSSSTNSSSNSSSSNNTFSTNSTTTGSSTGSSSGGMESRGTRVGGRDRGRARSGRSTGEIKSCVNMDTSAGKSTTSSGWCAVTVGHPDLLAVPSVGVIRSDDSDRNNDFDDGSSVSNRNCTESGDGGDTDASEIPSLVDFIDRGGSLSGSGSRGSGRLPGRGEKPGQANNRRASPATSFPPLYRMGSRKLSRGESRSDSRIRIHRMIATRSVWSSSPGLPPAGRDTLPQKQDQPLLSCEWRSSPGLKLTIGGTVQHHRPPPRSSVSAGGSGHTAGERGFGINNPSPAKRMRVSTNGGTETPQAWEGLAAPSPPRRPETSPPPELLDMGGDDERLSSAPRPRNRFARPPPKLPADTPVSPAKRADTTAAPVFTVTPAQVAAATAAAVAVAEEAEAKAAAEATAAGVAAALAEAEAAAAAAVAAAVAAESDRLKSLVLAEQEQHQQQQQQQQQKPSARTLRRRDSTGSIGWGRFLPRAGSFAGTPKVKDGLTATRRWYLSIANDTSSRKIGPRSLTRQQAKSARALIVPSGSAFPATAAATTTPSVARAGKEFPDSADPAAFRWTETGGRGRDGGEPEEEDIPPPAGPVLRRPQSCPTRAAAVMPNAEIRAGNAAGEGSGAEWTAWSDGGDEASGGAVIAWRGKRRDTPSLLKRAAFAVRDPGAAFFRVHLLLWLAATALLVADRLLWNVWPRQDIGGICEGGGGSVGEDGEGRGGCGQDFFCEMDEAPGCLIEGPASVKAFDLVARVTGRVIIATTNLILTTSCDGTWERLSEAKPLRGVLSGWAVDNFRLRRIGLWTMAVAVCLHVYGLLLPWVGADYASEARTAVGISWPAQFEVAGPVDNRVDVEAKTIAWAPDDLLGVAWVTALLLLSGLLAAPCFGRLRGSRGEVRGWGWPDGTGGSGSGGSGGSCGGFSGAFWWWLKALGTAAVVIESFRRRSHPHVWFVNGPALLWYAADRLCCRFRRSMESPPVDVTRIPIDSDYALLLWSSSGGGGGNGSSREEALPPPSKHGAPGTADTGDILSSPLSRPTALLEDRATARRVSGIARADRGAGDIGAVDAGESTLASPVSAAPGSNGTNLSHGCRADSRSIGGGSQSAGGAVDGSNGNQSHTGGAMEANEAWAGLVMVDAAADSDSVAVTTVVRSIAPTAGTDNDRQPMPLEETTARVSVAAYLSAAAGLQQKQPPPQPRPPPSTSSAVTKPTRQPAGLLPPTLCDFGSTGRVAATPPALPCSASSAATSATTATSAPTSMTKSPVASAVESGATRPPHAMFPFAFGLAVTPEAVSVTSFSSTARGQPARAVSRRGSGALPPWDRVAIVRARVVKSGSRSRSRSNSGNDGGGAEASKSPANPTAPIATEEEKPTLGDVETGKRLASAQSGGSNGGGDGGEQPPRSHVWSEDMETGARPTAPVAMTKAILSRGPSSAALSGLAAFPDTPPLLVVGTGAGGAGLVIEFLAHVAAVLSASASRKLALPPATVTVAYSCDSPALLRLVTTELLARKRAIGAPSGIRIVTGLDGSSSLPLFPRERGEDGVPKAQQQQQQRVDCASAGGRRGRTSRSGPPPLLLGRLNLQGLVERASADTRVQYCGEKKFDRPLRAACARMCLRYTGVCV
eukprot:g17328.t1